MSSSNSKTLKEFFPERLRDNYYDIRKLLTNCSTPNNDILSNLETLINDAQPKNDTEEYMRTTFQVMYRKNPMDLYKFIVKNKLFYLILWTEAKCMARHFRLKDLIYIKWNGESYKCFTHVNCSAQIPIEEPVEALPETLPTTPESDPNNRTQQNA